MLKNIIKIEFLIEEKLYQFMCDNDCKIEHVKEALFQCQKYVGHLEDNILAKLSEDAAQKNNDSEVISSDSKETSEV